MYIYSLLDRNVHNKLIFNWKKIRPDEIQLGHILFKRAQFLALLFILYANTKKQTTALSIR